MVRPKSYTQPYKFGKGPLGVTARVVGGGLARSAILVIVPE